MNNIKYTIFTPAYNRAKTLMRCYKSLLAQNVEEIEWIVIDDGSSDNTASVMYDIINEKKIRVIYEYQENAGKQAAWNKSIHLARGEYFICLDSDDALCENAMDIISRNIINIDDDDNIIGLRCLARRSDTGRDDSTYRINNDMVSNWFFEFASGASGEKIDVLKTRFLFDYLYPVEPGVKFIPEVWFYSTLSKRYNFLYLNDFIREFYDDSVHNRLSLSSLRKHAMGHKIARGAMLKNIPFICFVKNPIGFMKTIVRYAQVSFLCYWDNKNGK